MGEAEGLFHPFAANPEKGDYFTMETVKYIGKEKRSYDEYRSEWDEYSGEAV